MERLLGDLPTTNHSILINQAFLCINLPFIPILLLHGTEKALNPVAEARYIQNFFLLCGVLELASMACKTGCSILQAGMDMDTMEIAKFCHFFPFLLFGEPVYQHRSTFSLLFLSRR